MGSKTVHTLPMEYAGQEDELLDALLNTAAEQLNASYVAQAEIDAPLRVTEAKFTLYAIAKAGADFSGGDVSQRYEWLEVARETLRAYAHQAPEHEAVLGSIFFNGDAKLHRKLMRFAMAHVNSPEWFEDNSTFRTKVAMGATTLNI